MYNSRNLNKGREEAGKKRKRGKEEEEKKREKERRQREKEREGGKKEELLGSESCLVFLSPIDKRITKGYQFLMPFCVCAGGTSSCIILFSTVTLFSPF